METTKELPQGDNQQVEVVETPIQIANRRSDWKKVHRKIQRVIVTYYKDNAAFPSYREIAKLADLGVDTVFHHMQELDVDQIVKENVQNLAMLGDQLFMAIFNTALKGNTTAQQMLLNGVFKSPMVASPQFAQQNNYYSNGSNPADSKEPMTEEEVKEVDISLANLAEIAQYRQSRKALEPIEVKADEQSTSQPS